MIQGLEGRGGHFGGRVGVGLEHGIARHEMGGLHFDFHLCSIGLCVVYRNENVSKAMIQFMVYAAYTN